MKLIRATYWITSGIIALVMTYSAYLYLTQPMLDQAFQHLGFPAYFRIELAIAKFAGAILILLPIGPRFKEWVYAGFTIVFISAFIAHAASGDAASHMAGPVVFTLLLAVSYFTYHRLQGKKQAVSA
jgi:uncharacterized membrane protein YphA (DoxX/SURF4 family)